MYFHVSSWSISLVKNKKYLPWRKPSPLWYLFCIFISCLAFRHFFLNSSMGITATYWQCLHLSIKRKPSPHALSYLPALLRGYRAQYSRVFSSPLKNIDTPYLVSHLTDYDKPLMSCFRVDFHSLALCYRPRGVSYNLFLSSLFFSTLSLWLHYVGSSQRL